MRQKLKNKQYGINIRKSHYSETIQYLKYVKVKTYM